MDRISIKNLKGRVNELAEKIRKGRINDQEIKEHERKSRDLDKIIKNMNSRKNRLQHLYVEIRELIKLVKTGSIDKDGYITLAGQKDKKVKIAGRSTHKEPSNYILDCDPVIELKEGEPLIGLDQNMSIVKIGIVQKWRIPEKLKLLLAKGKGRTRPIRHGTDENITEEKEKEIQRGETAMVLYKGKQKSPFEILGLLPSSVKSLSEEELKIIVEFVSKTLMKLLHPDRNKKNPGYFSDVSSIMSRLENPEVFKVEKDKYGNVKPADFETSEIQDRIKRLRALISELIKKSAKMKIELERVKRRVKITQDERRGLVDLLVNDVFGNSTSLPQNPGAFYLRRSNGFVLSLLEEDGIKRYVLETKAFDVFLVSDKRRIKLLGSSPEGKFPNYTAARDALEGKLLEDTISFVHPVLYPNGILVGLDDSYMNNRPKVLGKIEEIQVQEAKKVGRKMSKRIRDVKVGLQRQSTLKQ